MTVHSLRAPPSGGGDTPAAERRSLPIRPPLTLIRHGWVHLAERRDRVSHETDARRAA